MGLNVLVLLSFSGFYILRGETENKGEKKQLSLFQQTFLGYLVCRRAPGCALWDLLCLRKNFQSWQRNF